MTAALAAGSLTLGAPVCIATELSASLERNPIRADETVRLVLEADQGTISAGPDLSPLHQDFEILGTSTSTQIQFVDGQQSASTRWIVEIAPRRPGRLRIPSLSLGERSTPELELEVLAAPTTGGDPAGDIFLEAEVSTTEPYVQAQVTYAVRLFRAVEILDGTLQSPRAGDALVQRLGRDLGYSLRRNGRTYRVLERRYAIFPQSSGVLEIPRVRFDGEVADASAGSSAFNRLFTRGRRVRLATEAFRLEVRVQPPEFRGATWLPARTLNLIEQWSDDPPTPQVGEPITRTLTLKATGLRGEHLPEIEFEVSEGLKIYPDQPRTKTTTDSELVYGVRQQRFALVPTRAGDVRLGEIRIRWWDSAADAAREALIPARTLTVAAAAPEASAVLPALAPLGQLGDSSTSALAGSGAVRRWQVACAVLALLWASTGLAWWRARRGGIAETAESERAPRRDRSRRALRAACGRDDAQAAKDALLDWSAAAWPDERPAGLPTLASRLDHRALARELLGLDRSLYGTRPREWRGEALWKQAKRGLALRASLPEEPPPLPELYAGRYPNLADSSPVSAILRASRYVSDCST